MVMTLREWLTLTNEMSRSWREAYYERAGWVYHQDRDKSGEGRGGWSWDYPWWWETAKSFLALGMLASLVYNFGKWL
jgi:hypothetical protein